MIQTLKRRNSPRRFHPLVEIPQDWRTSVVGLSSEPPRDPNQSSARPVKGYNWLTLGEAKETPYGCACLSPKGRTLLSQAYSHHMTGDGYLAAEIQQKGAIVLTLWYKPLRGKTCLAASSLLVEIQRDWRTPEVCSASVSGRFYAKKTEQDVQK